MTPKSIKNVLFISLFGVYLVLQACVPARQLEESKEREKKCNEENTRLKDANRLTGDSLKEFKSKADALSKSVEELLHDTTTQGLAYRRLNALYEELTESYEKLLLNNERLMQGNSEEARRLIAQLGRAQEDLQRKEDQLRRDSLIMVDRQEHLDSLKASLKERDERVRQLESVLGQSDSMVNTLKNAVSKALLGFKDSGLTVEQRGSKVYVSLSEKLLFASGSTVVQKKGEEALQELGRVLEKSPDISIMIEGHTDNVPISGTLPSGARDNWELSVLRATSVAKIILKGTKIEPGRVTASGRASYQPLDPANTKEAREKNRRTEIILSPKLDDLLKLLDQINEGAR
jgi:chemotaxis protein MotB